MSLTRLIVGIILLILIYTAVNEWRKWRARIQKEDELAAAKEESRLVDIDEDIALTKLDTSSRRTEVDAINNPDEEV